MKYLLFLFPIFLQAQCLIPTHSYRLICADEVRYADSISSGSRLYISSKNSFVTSPRSVFSLVNGYGQHFIKVTNAANSQKVAVNRAWINRIDSTSGNKALIYIKDISVTFTTAESYTAVKDSAIACFVRAVASGLATLSDGDYGDVIVSGGGLVMTVDKPDLGLHNLADGDFSVTADSTALSLTNTRAITLQTKNIDGWISRYLQNNTSLTLRANSTTKTSRIFVDTTGANFQFVNGANNASLRIGDSVAVRFNTSGSVGQVLTVTSVDGDGRLVVNPKTVASGSSSLADGSVTWPKLATPVKDSIRLIRGVNASRLADSTASIRSDFPVSKRDTSIYFTGNYNMSSSIGEEKISRLYRNIGISGAGSGTLRIITLPDGSPAMADLTVTVAATEDSIRVLSAVNDAISADGRNIPPGQVRQYKCVITGAAHVWLSVDNNGLISALRAGDVGIDGATSSDLRIRNTRVQFDARMKIGADSSFIHDPGQDTTVIKGDIVLGKFCTTNTFPFSMRNAASGSTTLLIESGASTGYAGLKLVSYNLPSQIEFGGTTSKYLNFYNANNARNILSVGTNTNARTVLIGNIDPAVNGALIVNDTITSGKGLAYFRKIGSNSTPILTLTSVSNDRFVFHDDGRAFFNNLGTGTATQTLGITSSGQVVPYTQVLPTAHASAIDANVDISTQVNSSINTYVTYYLTSGTSRNLTLPAPTSVLAGRSVIVSYNATAFGYTGVILNTSAGYNEFWNANSVFVGEAFSFSAINLGRQSTATWVCRQVNGVWYWVQDSYFDPAYIIMNDGYKTSVTGTTLTFTEGVEASFFFDFKLLLYKNGLLLYPTVDYSVSTSSPMTITLTTAAISSDKFYFNYK